MNSPKYLNYETRPLKFTERKMLLTCLSRVCNFFSNNYQYIGFGGLAFTDFKLFHKDLSIDELISIEGGDFSIERIKFNSPFSFIKIHNTLSTAALKDVDLTKKTLVWLDYDKPIEDYMFDDIAVLFNKLPIGSIYILTCNRRMRDDKTGSNYTKDSFKEKFGSIVPFDVESTDFAAENNNKILRTLFLKQINRVLKDRNFAEDKNICFKQLFNILYQENQGAKMFTFGGVLIDDTIDYEKIGLGDFDFINNEEDTSTLTIPNLTRRESELIEKYLDNKDELMALKIVDVEEFEDYRKIYKYIPHFFDIRV